MQTCRCGAELAPSARRPRKYCSAACRWAAWNARHPRVDALPEHERRDIPAWQSQADTADCDCNNADDAFCSCQGECPCHEAPLWRES